MRLLQLTAIVFFSSALLSADSLNILNSGFEVPNLSTGVFGGCVGPISGPVYIYGATGCGAAWTFEGGSGLTQSPSAFGNPLGPDGSAQAAFLQETGDFYQTISGIDAGGLYTISFYAVQRNCCVNGNLAQTVTLTFGGATLTFNGGASTSVHPDASGWTLYTTDPFVAQGGDEVLKFNGNYTLGDATAFVDQISSTETGVVPEPGTWGLLAGGLGGLIWALTYLTHPSRNWRRGRYLLESRLPQNQTPPILA
jgi:hypothetical protein